MTLQTSTAVAAGTTEFHYVDWGAIIAGAVLASAISILMFTFGTAIGLSIVSPWEGEGVSTTAYFITLGLWTLWVVVSSFMAGGYIAGRLRRRIGDSTEHESDVRDSSHGLLVWALGLVLASLLLAAGISGAAGVVAKGAGAAGAVAANTDDYTIDSLLRPNATAGAVSMTTPDTESMTTRNNYAATLQSDRQEIGRLLVFGRKSGELTADTKTYLAQRISAHTGLSQTEAQARMDQVLADAKKKADDARKLGVVIAFLTAAALAVAAAAAAWAANLGGRHRDQGTDLAMFWRWR
jgi:hypothetical protein